MAKVIARCRLTGHYMHMGIDVDPEDLANASGPFARKYCPFCACEHLWYKEDARVLKPKVASAPRVQQAS